MPAPSSDAFIRSPDSRSLNHVYAHPLRSSPSTSPPVANHVHVPLRSNLMVDSFIANARVEECVPPSSFPLLAIASLATRVPRP